MADDVQVYISVRSKTYECLPVRTVFTDLLVSKGASEDFL